MEVFESLPPELQECLGLSSKAFLSLSAQVSGLVTWRCSSRRGGSKDLSTFLQVARQMEVTEFEKHFNRCKQAGRE